ncbi:MAG: alpha amylase C-terminal domain-containing protein, partial [Chitinophagaceae bacterium]
FEWVDLSHRSESVICYRRKAKNSKEDVVVLLNMTPVERRGWVLELQGKKAWNEIFNSDDAQFGGTGHFMNPEIHPEWIDKKHHRYALRVDLPPLAGIILK